MTSAVYILNDIKDAPFDKLNPKKRNRPIASDMIKKEVALVISILLLFLSLFLTLLLGNLKGLSCLLIYLFINVFYTFSGKNLVLIDVFCISAGFALRVLYGSYIINVLPSGWLVVMTFFLALFLGFGKRRGEIVQLQHDAANHRQVLRYYSLSLLDMIIVATGTVTMMMYALYTLDQSVAQRFGTDKLYLTIPFVVYGIFRYILLLLTNSEGDPTEIVTKDRGMIFSMILWITSVLLIIYLGR